MTTKILAGIAAAILVTLIGVYASTGSIPGLNAVTDAAGLTTSEGGSCCSKSAAATCPVADVSCCAEASECPATSEALGACAGSMTISAAQTTTVQTKKKCCSEE